MSEVQAIEITNITRAGSAAGGEFIYLTVKIKGADGSQPEMTLLLPYGFFTGLIPTLLSAAKNAHSDLLKRLGNEQSVMHHQGSVAIRPTDYEFGHATDEQGNRMLNLLLKIDKVPVIDIAMTEHEAHQIGSALVEEAAKAPPSPPQKQ